VPPIIRLVTTEEYVNPSLRDSITAALNHLTISLESIFEHIQP